MHMHMQNIYENNLDFTAQSANVFLYETDIFIMNGSCDAPEDIFAVHEDISPLVHNVKGLMVALTQSSKQWHFTTFSKGRL